ncbi:hypothetical protein JTB14_032860 [Gonioctena quinquepunctata]|nr:hypothetical protein JTB14_032860 [Gonioctena quinquepunctata]
MDQPNMTLMHPSGPIQPPNTTHPRRGKGNRHGGPLHSNLQSERLSLGEEAKLLYSQEMAAMPSKTPVSVLQELLSRRGITPKYELVQIEGAIHEPIFRYRVFLSNELVATGTGRSKKDAKHAAAKNLLDLLVGKMTPEQANQTNGTPGAADITNQVVSPYDDKVMGNPIGWLQEMCMSRRWPPPSYDMEHEEGLPHERQFTIACQVLKFREVGTGKSKKLAKRMAAHKMWQALQDLPLEGNNLPIGYGSEEDTIVLSTKEFNFVQFLQDIATEQSFEVTYVDIEEKSLGGRCQCLVQLSTLPVAVCYGVGKTSKEAKASAAHHALEYLKIMTKNNRMFKMLQTLNRFRNTFSTSLDVISRPVFLQKLCDGSSDTVRRNFSSSSNLVKVTVVGGAGKIGQPLSLMLKQSPLIDELCIHDVRPTGGVAMELNHIDTNCRVTAFTGIDNIAVAMKNSKVVVVLAAAPESDLLSYEKMWSPNAQMVQEIVTIFAKSCPKAFLAIGTNPINSLVPMACEVLKKAGCFNPNTVFGITSLDTVRANTFVAQVQGIEPECVMVPVVGGHTEETIIPVLSATKPKANFTNEELENITMNIRKAQENMLNLTPAESASLASAFATARFVISLVKALRGYPEIVESAYVYSKVHPQLKYLSTPLMLGQNGITKNLGLPNLSSFESCMLDNAIPTLTSDIKRGEKFVGVVDKPSVESGDLSMNAPRCPRNWCEFKKEQEKLS